MSDLYPDPQGLRLSDTLDIDAAYTKHVMQLPQDDRQGVFHPSEVGACSRRIYYGYVRAPQQKNITERLADTFLMGHKVHDLVQSRLEGVFRDLEDEGYQVQCVVEAPYDHPEASASWLFTDLGIGGTTDLFYSIYHPRWGERPEQRAIVEIKSSKGKLFDELKAPKLDHVQQAHIYAIRFNATVIHVWYFNKDTAERKVFTSLFDPQIGDQAVNKFADVLARVPSQDTPPREESWFGCKSCDYAHLCDPKVLRKSQNSQKFTQLRTRGFRKNGTPSR